MQQDLIGAGALGALFLGLIVAAEVWGRLGAKPEWTRKLVHVAGGLVCLAFPFVISSPWVVGGMAAGMSGLFLLGARAGGLRSLHGIDRVTRGSEYYPPAVFLVFVMSMGRPWLYVSSLLVLAVADGFAALVGGRYGSVRYQVEDEYKSLEGSVVFLLIAFLAIHLPMLLLSDLPRVVCVLAALLTALLATGFEAICTRGADNLFVPIGVCAVLTRITTKPVWEIGYQTLSLLGICLVVSLVVRRSRSFNVGGTIVFLLFTYGVWSLGSGWWAVPVFSGFVVFTAAWFALPSPMGVVNVKVRTMVRALMVPFLVMLGANVTGEYGVFFGPFVGALGGVLSLALWNHVLFHLLVDNRCSRSRRVAYALSAGLMGWAGVVSLPWWVMGGVGWGLPLLIGLGCVGVAIVDERSSFGAGAGDVAAVNRWTGFRFVLTGLLGLTVLGGQWVGLVGEWVPR